MWSRTHYMIAALCRDLKTRYSNIYYYFPIINLYKPEMYSLCVFRFNTARIPTYFAK